MFFKWESGAARLTINFVCPIGRFFLTTITPFYLHNRKPFHVTMATNGKQNISSILVAASYFFLCFGCNVSTQPTRRNNENHFHSEAISFAFKKLFGLKIICELQFSTKQFDLNKVLSDSYLSIWNRYARLVSAI